MRCGRERRTLSLSIVGNSIGRLGHLDAENPPAAGGHQERRNLQGVASVEIRHDAVYMGSSRSALFA